jgi:hypothetical protein
MAVWRTYSILVIGVVFCPLIALAGSSQPGQQRMGQSDRSQPHYTQQELQQIQQLSQNEGQQQTLMIDQAIRQAQQEAAGIVVQAALTFPGVGEQSGSQRSRSRQSQSDQGSQLGAGHPQWQIQVLNPEDRRLTQVQVDAQTGQITDRQEYPIQQANR